MMEERRRHERRTGVIFLVLVAATNVVVWMEPVAHSRVAGETLAETEFNVALASCLLAAGLVLGAWLLGRHSRGADRPAISRARLLGLRLSLLSAILNLALVGMILFFFFPSLTGPVSERPLLAFVWYLILLPLQAAAGYAMGRGSQAGGRRALGSRPLSDQPDSR